ncbi:hypothetical protein SASPL_157049 [Salvia splendens]|uniref:VWFA domain-containing protein n=1 Tax=Salvia splendens TaxID=180675 RepID=A0A8X8VVM2_SALSN|nr:hypothetical protein SASPL_157049 [Salvia splendens]
MAEDFSRAVELGLKLSKRIYYGKDKSTAASAPPRQLSMTAEAESFLPTAPMVYAEINDPSMVDNPDVPSYQPYVYGRCDPPVLIPMRMHRVSLEVDCCLDTAFVTVSGAWRLDCVSASRSCSCRIAMPIGEQGSVLGVEVESPFKSFSRELIPTEDAAADAAKTASSKDGFLIKGHLYTFKVPKIDGGTILSVKFSWSQKLLYQDGRFSLNVPFTFPSYVNPVVKSTSKKENILVNVNSGTGTEVFFESTSHPIKKTKHEASKIGFSTEREVPCWSRDDFNFSYNVASNEIVGGVLLQSPPLHDFDEREMFCLYLYPGKIMNHKVSLMSRAPDHSIWIFFVQVFRKEVVFLVDISASMQGTPLDSTKEMIGKASEWIEMKFIAEGGTNIAAPLNQFSKAGGSLPLVFLVTDGAVEDEKEICDRMRRHIVYLTSFDLITLSLVYVARFVLQPLLLANACTNRKRMCQLAAERFISNAIISRSSNISVDSLKISTLLEIYPAQTPDLSTGKSSTGYGEDKHGSFPDNVIARRQVDSLTRVCMVIRKQTVRRRLHKTEPAYRGAFRVHQHNCCRNRQMHISCHDKKQSREKRRCWSKEEDIHAQPRIGFGNLEATAENRPPEQADQSLLQQGERPMRDRVHSALHDSRVLWCIIMCAVRYVLVIKVGCVVLMHLHGGCVGVVKL